MQEFVNRLQKGLNEQLDQICFLEDEESKRNEKSFYAAQLALTQLKERTILYSFKSVDEEIEFFKIIKPHFVSRVLYYSAVLKINLEMPLVSSKMQRKYLLKSLHSCNKHYLKNKPFYEYYLAGAVFLDHTYFVRSGQHLLLKLNEFHPDADPRFCTSHDYTVSKLLANGMLRKYLEGRLKELDTSRSKNHQLDQAMRDGFHWTSSKTDLIELIYSLHAAGSINNGNTDIKKLATFFESAFNIELGDYYRTYLDMRNRKIARTKYLDNLKNKLSHRMDQDDD
jgi:hypothetical protein